MVWSFVYLALCRLVQLVVLLCRSQRLLIFSRRQLEHVLRVYVRHYNEQRPHRALDLQAPDPCTMPSTRGQPAGSATAIRRQDLLGGLIHEYEPVAA